jgi:hypothetical protein
MVCSDSRAVCYPICYPIKRHRVGQTGIVETDSLPLTLQAMLPPRNSITGIACCCARAASGHAAALASSVMNWRRLGSGMGSPPGKPLCQLSAGSGCTGSAESPWDLNRSESRRWAIGFRARTGKSPDRKTAGCRAPTSGRSRRDRPKIGPISGFLHYPKKLFVAKKVGVTHRQRKSLHILGVPCL